MRRHSVRGNSSSDQSSVLRALPRLNLIAAGVLASGFVAVPAYAQSADADTSATASDSAALAEVVVTAERRKQSLQDVPVSVTAINAETIEKANVKGIEDVFAMTPNVSFISSGSRDRKDLSIRGINNQINAYDDVRSSSYAFYIDDFNVSAGTSNPEVLDMQQIEVLRGPQGTYFGRNALGGAINITTNKPTNDWLVKGGLGYSSYDTRHAEAIVNVPVIKDIFAIRAAGQIDKSDGWIKNINPIGGGNDSDYKSGRVIGRFTPNSRLTSDLTYSYSNEETGMRAGVPTGFLTRTWAAVYYGGSPGYGLADPDGVGFYPDNRDEVNYDRPQKVGTKFHYFDSRTTYDFDTAQLTAVIGHLNTTIFNYGDVDGGSYDYYYENFALDRDSTSGELRLQSTGSGPLEWSFGAMYGRDSGEKNQVTYNGADAQSGDEGTEITGTYSNASINYAAAFAQATWHFNEQWALTGGGRYSHDDIHRHIIDTSSGTTNNDDTRQVTFNDFSPRLTLNYAVSKDWMNYATISKGYKAGGVQTSQLSLKNDYAPEKLWNYELGTKLELFDHRLRLDAAVFYMDWQNVQQSSNFQYFDDNGDLVSVSGISNASSASSTGVELSADAAITRHLRLSVQAGYLDSKFDSYKNALVDGQTFDASGMQMIAAPRWTGGAQAQYTVPVFDAYDAFIRGEWSVRSSMLSNNYALLYNEKPFISPGYNNINLRVGFEGEKFSVVAYAQNLFDNNYYNNAYEKAFYSGVQVEPSYRSFGVSLKYTFVGK
ncbi:TonB-dependent receptor [Solimonas marina]|uniref:TonB-dependent receptor n=1 Tax=Solimonas marina TaxID=2714601 RepID=A0A969WAK7_9GAMM|nr:TonB-dependent receptor [Solimonas marina]NKF22609.1 TonB-dependent receptor [Solimonas marina]